MPKKAKDKPKPHGTVNRSDCVKIVKDAITALTARQDEISSNSKLKNVDINADNLLELKVRTLELVKDIVGALKTSEFMKQQGYGLEDIVSRAGDCVLLGVVAGSEEE